MLIDISIKNYLSFKNKTTFALQSVINKRDKNENIYKINDKIGILRTSAIYGYNASGKSNLLKAILLIKSLITESRKIGPNDPIAGNFILQPFLLNIETSGNPMEFEVNFEIDSLQYRYNFSLTQHFIVSENLYCKKTQKEKILFTRELQQIKIYDFDDNNSINRVNENNLALSVFAKEGSIEAKKIHKFFQGIYIFLGFPNSRDSEEMMLSEHQIFKPFLKNLLGKADFGISDIDFSLTEIPFNNLPNPNDLRIKLEHQGIPVPASIPNPIRNILHKVYDNSGNVVGQQSFGLQNESIGTNKIINLAGSIYNIIRQGKILFIDEIDSSIHPRLLLNFIYSFQKIDINSKYQIVFTTQDMYIMNVKDTLRRDQIRFVEKDDYGVSNLKRLSDEKIRKEYISEKNYFKGDFGGTNGCHKIDNFFNL